MIEEVDDLSFAFVLPSLFGLVLTIGITEEILEVIFNPETRLAFLRKNREGIFIKNHVLVSQHCQMRQAALFVVLLDALVDLMLVEYI